MSKVRIELNSPGIRALLRSPEMQAVLKSRADTVKDHCGDGYESYVAQTRAVAVVETASQNAYERQFCQQHPAEGRVFQPQRCCGARAQASSEERQSHHCEELIYTATLAVQPYGSSWRAAR